MKSRDSFLFLLLRIPYKIKGFLLISRDFFFFFLILGISCKINGFLFISRDVLHTQALLSLKKGGSTPQRYVKKPFDCA